MFLVFRGVIYVVRHHVLQRASWSEHDSRHDESQTFLAASSADDAPQIRNTSPPSPTLKDSSSRLDARATARLALEFSLLWFLANFSQATCLEYTSVASATILFSTSSIWTLLYGHWTGVEVFTYRKLLAVLASLAGVSLVALGDFSGQSDDQRGHFPHKEPAEIAAGDVIALLSAVLYGVYVTRFKHNVGDESRVDMLLFLACVGLANVLLLWPGFFLLHWTGLETFEWPSTDRVVLILLVSTVTDACEKSCFT